MPRNYTRTTKRKKSINKQRKGIRRRSVIRQRNRNIKTRKNRRTFKKTGGNPQANLNNKLKKTLNEEFTHAFVVADQIGSTPTAPDEQLRKTLLYREAQKKENRKEKKSSVKGIPIAKSNQGNSLASAITEGYSKGVSAGSAVKSRFSQLTSGIGSALGTKVPTTFGELRQSGSNLFGRSGQKQTGTTSTGRRTTSGKAEITIKKSDDESADTVADDSMPPMPPDSSSEIKGKCPVCNEDTSTEIEISNIFDGLKNFSGDEIGKITTMSEKKKSKKYDKLREDIKEKFEKIFGDGKEGNEGEIGKLWETRKEEIKSLQDEEQKNRNEKARERTQKMKKQRINDVKNKCKIVGEANNRNIKNKISNLRSLLEKAEDENNNGNNNEGDKDEENE